MSTRDKAMRIHDDFKECYRVDGQSSASAAGGLRTVLREFSAAVDNYKIELAAYAKNV